MRNITFIAILAAILFSCKDKSLPKASGTFEAREITLSAEAGGRLTKLAVEEGDSVSKGDLLALTDTSRLHLQKLAVEAKMRALTASRPDIGKQLAEIEDNLSAARKEKNRVERLLEGGAATSKQLDDINAKISALESRLSAASSALGKSSAGIDANYSALEVEKAMVQDMLDKSAIQAPINGVITGKYKEESEFAAPGVPVLKMADMENMHLRAYFTSGQLSSLKVGDKMKVWADYGGGIKFEYEGKVVWIASESEFTPKGIQTDDTRANLVYAVKIAVRNDGRLKAGMYGTVEKAV